MTAKNGAPRRSPGASPETATAAGFSADLHFTRVFIFVTQRRRGGGGAEFLVTQRRRDYRPSPRDIPNQGGSAAAEIPARNPEIPKSRNAGTLFPLLSGASLPAFFLRTRRGRVPTSLFLRTRRGRVPNQPCASARASRGERCRNFGISGFRDLAPEFRRRRSRLDRNVARRWPINAAPLCDENENTAETLRLCVTKMKLRLKTIRRFGSVFGGVRKAPFEQ